MLTLGLAKGVVTACTNAKKAVDWFKKVQVRSNPSLCLNLCLTSEHARQEVPEQGFVLWKAMESIARPLEVNEHAHVKDALELNYVAPPPDSSAYSLTSEQ